MNTATTSNTTGIVNVNIPLQTIQDDDYYREGDDNDDDDDDDEDWNDDVLDHVKDNDHTSDDLDDEDDTASAAPSSSKLSYSSSSSLKEREQEERAQLAKNETRTVIRLRWLLACILSAVVGIGVFGYIYLRQSNQEAFVNEFNAQASKVVDGFRSDSVNKLKSLQALSTSLTSYARDSNQTWPFVRIHKSAQFLDPYLTLSGAASIVIMPIVGARQRVEWEEYSVEQSGWIEEDLETRKKRQSGRRSLEEEQEEKRSQQKQEQEEDNKKTRSKKTTPRNRNLQYFTESARDTELDTIAPYIKNYVGIDVSPGPWITWWQYAPVIPNKWFVNFNRLAFEFFDQESRGLLQGKAAISSTQSFVPGLDFQSTRDFTFADELLSINSGGGNSKNDGYTPGEPIGYIYYPIFRDLEEQDTTDESSEGDVSAILMMTVYWKSYFQDILPENTKGIVCVVENNINQVFTYQVNGEDADFMGMEDLHEEKYNSKVISASFVDSHHQQEYADNSDYTGAALDETAIQYQIHIYPSSEFEDDFSSSLPVVFTSVMLFIFIVTIVVFVAYDRVVQQRQDVVMAAAERSGAVLASLFPKAVTDRLLDEALLRPTTGKSRLKKFLTNTATENDDDSDEQGGNNTNNNNVYQGSDDYAYKTKPIADLFPETTIMMCDLVGFTAWSSTREPEQVFTLLETLYHTFDVIAERRGVFKVETVGDCYVAVCGLPDPRADHAVVMARFARDCMTKMQIVLNQLEIHLGPETGDLSMRFGLHSGPVTAGVLRGERSRFQLFGDTVNTAARMESSGAAGKIHVSEVTANLLIKDGKTSWLTKREGKCELKGKGFITSYWLRERRAHGGGGGSVAGSVSKEGSMRTTSSSFKMNPSEGVASGATALSKKTKSLVQWNVEALSKLLRQIIAHRGETSQKNASTFEWSVDLKKQGGTVIEEVQEIVALPKFSRKGASRRASQQHHHGVDANSIVLAPEVDGQLKDFITQIAYLYRDNPFHNFEHASHVTMSVMKLLARIVAPDDVNYDEIKTHRVLASKLHDHTYGITSDPLTQFACVLSALIHDVDHTGVPNIQLVNEQADVAKQYKNVSVAEQNSVDMAWDLLMSERFKDLRAAIAQTDAEVERFRQLVVNVVLATDIVDKDLKALRNQRWDRAFSSDTSVVSSSAGGGSNKDETDRKATIVIEHLIQASDVAHTMQHWHVYRKWNAKLFREMSKAYKEGRAEKNPAEGWYTGELGFYDFYIIPLAKKLKECGVFGVSSDEYLNYALSNRKEWEEKGQRVVEELVEDFQKDWEATHS